MEVWRENVIEWGQEWFEESGSGHKWETHTHKTISN